MINEIKNIDCLQGLKELPDCSVNCCVTSPPYYGLRDYGVDGQIGLEETPEAYVEKMVTVFREVRRVLKDDGTLFLNLGDSYWGSGKGGNPENSKWSGFMGNKNREKSAMPLSNASVQRATSCGTSDKESEGCLMNDCFSQSLCDVCQRDYHTHISRNDLPHVPMQSVLLSSQILEYMEELHDHLATSDFLRLQQIMQSYFSTQDLRRFVSLESSQIAASLQTNFALFFQQFQDSYSLISNNVLSHLPFETLIHYVQEFAHRLHHELLKMPYYTQGNASPSEEPGQNNQYICGYCSQCGAYSNTLKTYIQPQSYKEFSNLPKTIKPKDLIGIPWMVAFALRADGWYLRQDIIWHKPNPMPESVTDRCTKSHEYIFLLSKSARYYYDQDAIAEACVWDEGGMTEARVDRAEEYHKAMPNSRKNGGDPRNGHRTDANSQWGKVWDSDKPTRNRRSVWTVTTKPFSEAHFATFPEDLIVPCIKAGCPEGGVVLDPFMGAGTTAVVARKLNRNYTGFELNPDYIKIAGKRLYQELGMFL